MDEKLTLYHFPGSYFSAKALMVLLEKGLQFDEVYVNIRGGDQRTDWYMKVNPKGEVPALKHGGKVIVDSETIIDYVDRVFKQEPKLVPEVTSSIGQEVQEIRQMLNTIMIDHITYGVFANERLRVGDIRYFPKVMLKTVSKDALAKEYNESIKELQEKLPASPEIASQIQWKIKDLEEKRDVVTSEEKTSAALDTLEPIFDRLEQCLEKNKQGSDDDGDAWLTGKQFTAADITTSVLLFRMWFIGLDERYFTEQKRPHVYRYFMRIQQRPSYQKMTKIFRKSILFVLKTVAWSVTKMLLKLGAVVGLIGLTAYTVRELRKK